MVLHADYSYGSRFEKDGNMYTVVSNEWNSDYIIVTDEFGNVIRQDKNKALLEFLKDREGKREEEIAYYQKKADIACEEKNGFKKLIKNLRDILSGLNKNEEEYAIIESQISEATGNKIAASNRETSYLLGAFMAASDPIV